MNKIMRGPLRIEDRFYPKAKELRQHFELRFQNPLQTHANRFVWDYWLVPDQYKLLRTPAESFFPSKIFQPFLAHLLSWSRNHLGCQMISHPWLSVYTDGCYQSLHSDVPHGPWSFVYSLTPWDNRCFKGGETVIAKNKLLNYFSEIRHDTSDEKKQLFTEVEPKFNRLTVFDPRYPHGVNTVRGEDELLKSRVVIHGWFTEPRPTIEGALNLKKALPTLDQLAMNWMQNIQADQVYGLLSLQLVIAPSGEIQTIKILSSHLVDDRGIEIKDARLKAHLENTVRFPKASGKTIITLPIEFKR